MLVFLVICANWRLKGGGLDCKICKNNYAPSATKQAGLYRLAVNRCMNAVVNVSVYLFAICLSICLFAAPDKQNGEMMVMSVYLPARLFCIEGRRFQKFKLI